MISLICLYFLPFLNFAETQPAVSGYGSFAHYNVAKYATERSRSFDAEGIIMQDRQYHPLTISMYGIMSYDAFVKTGDSTYYLQVLRQWNYFSNPEHIVYSDDHASAGLPYNFDFKDMKKPWVSGMTQGTAVSFLLRYYALTKNETALELCKKLIHLMLKKETEGGTIGRSMDGGPWIEEYPGSTKAKSVLNGFVNGFIGLHEYCRMFPEDKYAAVMRDSCYNEMINNLSKYDTPFWTSYSRNKNPISNSYLRYELDEFDHLYALFGDYRLRNQMRIWSRMALNKLDTTTVFLENPQYQYAMMLNGNPAKDSCVFNRTVGFTKGMSVVKPCGENRQMIRYRFDDDRYYCEVEIMNCDSATISKVNVQARKKDKSIPLVCQYSGERIIIESQLPFDELTVRFPSKSMRKLHTTTLKSYDYTNSTVPLFGYFNLEDTQTIGKGKTCQFNCNARNLTNATVFYRYAKTGESLTRSVFSIQQSFSLEYGSFVAPETGTYQFFVSYDLVHPYSSISKLEFIQL